MNGLPNISVLAVLVIVFLAVFLVRDLFARRIVKRWAAKHGYILVRYDGNAMHPFRGKKSHQQEVFYVVWLDTAGHEHSGWALCGDDLLGVFVEKISIRLEH